MQMYQQPPNQMPPMVQQAPQLAQAPVQVASALRGARRCSRQRACGRARLHVLMHMVAQVSGPTESSPDDKEQQRAQVLANTKQPLY